MKRLFLAAFLFPALLGAQIHLTGSLVIASHGGHSLESGAADQPRILPGPGLGGALTVGLDRGPFRLALVVDRQSGADLQVVGNESGVINRDQINATAFGLEVGARVIGSSDDPSLHLLAGVRSVRWSFVEALDPPTNRLGGVLAAEGAAPLGGGISAVLRADALLAGGILDAEQLPEGYQSETGRRLALMVGLRWQP